MNAITTTETNAIATATGSAIVVPANIANTDEIRAKATAIYEAVADVTVVSDKAGREMIHRAAMNLKDVRLEASKSVTAFEKDAKAQLKSVTEGVEKAVKFVKDKEESLLAIRDAYDKAQEQIKSAIKFAESAAVEAAGKSADQICAILERLNGTEVPGNADFTIAKEKALSVLNTLREAAIQQEKAAAEAAAKAAAEAEAQRAELARLRAMEAELNALRAAAQANSTGNVIDVPYTEQVKQRPEAVSEPIRKTEDSPLTNPNPNISRDEVIGLVASFYEITEAAAEAALKDLFGA